VKLVVMHKTGSCTLGELVYKATVGTARLK